MGRPYSEDLRRRIVAAVEAGVSCSAAARQFAVSVSCAIKLLQRWRRTGSVAPDPRGRKPYALADHEGLVRELVAARPDMTLDELHEELGRRGIRVGRSSIGRFLLAGGLTLKKRRFMPPSSSGRTSRPRGRFGAPANRA
jgi:transposase